MSIVVCKMPKAGLGNQLFPLMNAAVFAEINNLPLFVTGYHQIKLGPYLRREKSKRSYKGYFDFEKNIINSLTSELKHYFIASGKEKISEPELKVLTEAERNGKVFVFENMPHYKDYFSLLKPHRDLVRKLFIKMLSPAIKSQIEHQPAPEIGVHIRMGDFRKLAPGETFRGGHVRTPESYFINIIKALREIAGYNMKVSVFTDGFRHEFEQLFNLDNIVMVEGNKDIVDMIQLSKSKLIVISTGSTFSYWSGFLSEAPMIMHPDHIHARVRFEVENGFPLEGSFDSLKLALINYLK